MNRIASAVIVAVFAGSLLSCQQHVPPGDALPEEEKEARRALAQTPIALTGRLVSTDGSPIKGATLQLRDEKVTSGDDGSFRFGTLSRRNELLEIQAPGFRPDVIPVSLRRAVNEKEVSLAPHVLTAAAPDQARLLFTGDVSLGRRFIDPEEQTAPDAMPEDSPTALIQVSKPDQGAIKAMSFVKPLFATADYRVVNLESVVTDSPKTPHKTKPYVFFTLPGSLAGLTSIGVDYVGLGNNHIYDYLEAGITDTIRHVESAGFSHSGAGSNLTQALAPYRHAISGKTYSFVSACSVAGEEYDTNFLASDTKGGAADLRETVRVGEVILKETADGNLPVAVFHGGFEYSDRPSANVERHLKAAADEGAVIGIGHHPHTPQGFAWHNGVLLAYSLGNFAFDQDRMETMIGLVVEADFSGAKLDRARVLPVYLEDYRPRMISGALSDAALRRVAWLSHEQGAQLALSNGRAFILRPGNNAARKTRKVTVPVTVDAQGFAVVDARSHLTGTESVVNVAANTAGLKLIPGRDILRFGDFEDHDVDGDEGELARWDTGDEAAFPCVHAARRGVSGLCLVRSDYGGNTASAILRNRVRLPQDGQQPPNRFVSLVGWSLNRGAGKTKIEAEYRSTEGDKTFGNQTVLGSVAEQEDWALFARDFSLPAEPDSPTVTNSPRAFTLRIEHERPKQRDGYVVFDDLAVVAWESGQSGGTLTLPGPHDFDFIRVEAAAGTYELSLDIEEVSVAQ